MSGIGGIGVTAPQSSATTVGPRPNDLPAGQPQVSSNKDLPAVIVSLGDVAGPSQQPLPQANPDEVNRTLASLGGSNGFAWIYEHIDWDALAKEFGAEKAGENKESLLRAMSGGASYAGSLAAENRAIPVHQVANPDATVDEPLKTIYSVDDFSFTNNGSVYSITHGKNGLMNGTKDGQWWATWQITTFTPTASDSGAAIALKTLTPLTTQTTSTEQETSAIDVTV